ncbi:hypothetical protein BD779DRAFT_1387635, partial [Infundibulicybe gibba]
SAIPEVKLAAEFIEALKSATLDKSNMHPDDIICLREASPDFAMDIKDPNFLHDLGIFFSTTNSSRKTYEEIRRHALLRDPETPFLSFDQIKRRVETLSGVISIMHDMCIDTCIAFTGPYEDLEACPFCGKSRYEPDPLKPHKKIPRRQFVTIPIGPVIQA